MHHSFHDVVDVDVDPTQALVAEQGWQSWSPSDSYRVDQRPPRATTENLHRLCYRGDREMDPGVFRSHGVMAVQHHVFGPVTVIAGRDPRNVVPEIRAELREDRVVVSADAPVDVTVDHGPDGVDGALARWADRVANEARVGDVPAAPTVWCSWYHYFTQVAESDIDENVKAVKDLDLPIDVIQIDDGYQAEIGDWLTPSDRFASVPGAFARIHDEGFRSGVWTAPFFVGARSVAFREHPERLVKDAAGRPLVVGHHWDQQIHALDTTHPSSQEWLTEVFEWFNQIGLSYHKIDFVYAAAVEGVRHEDVDGIAAYRQGVQLIRDVIGADRYLLGCGAPQLPSIGLVDAMRVSPDTEPHHLPNGDDMSQPSIHAAMVTGRARAYMHARFWSNDPDCIIARPAIERRHDWAAHIGAFGGLRASSDRLADLDEWGLATTRRLLSEVPTAPFIPT
ncbi:glycoside hydrolase family 36 protein [Euzebya tangerina]|uniref:glycoside hydrolase family 36 protein n=1 Tax=Euzebya tangerina TaxID=591198 RepID=UPI000E30D43D|nr:glycoside hydrolase family 36 protein [Euzebya tangerina]